LVSREGLPTRGPAESPAGTAVQVASRSDPEGLSLTPNEGRIRPDIYEEGGGMFNFWTFLYLLCVGIIAGFLARLFVPGRDAFTWWQTILIGVIGSYVGGFLGYVLFGFDDDEGAIQPGGIFGSIIGAVVVLLIWREVRRRSEGRTADG
jgi:uncharacterized membrane protein YeaQ/YmgE (transglycosylase-associated protein family)